MIDRQIVHSANADLYRPDATAEGLSSPYVGFHFVVPPLFLDGAEHVLELFDSNARRLVLRSKDGAHSESWRISFRKAEVNTLGNGSSPSSIIAHIDDITDAGISG